MDTDLIDLPSDSELGESSDHHDQPPRSPATPPTLTSTSQDMEDWPEDKSEMAGQCSVVSSTRPRLSAIIIEDDSAAADSQSTPASPDDLPSPSMSEWGLIGNALRRSDAEPLPAVRPSLKSLRRLFQVSDSENSGNSPTSESATLGNSSSQFQSDDTEITMPGSSPENPIDLSDSGDDSCTLYDLSRSMSATVQDPRRRIVIPRATLAGEVEEVAHNGTILRASSTVKLANGLYLRVERITLREGQYHLWGRQLMGCHDSQWPPYIPKVKNELIWLPYMDHETQLESVQGHVPVSLMEVMGLCKVIFTNERRERNQQHTPGSGLFCRLKVTARKRPSISPHRHGGIQPGKAELDTSVEYLTFEECDEGHGFESNVLRNLYRGCRTVPFGEGQIRYSGLPTVTDENEDGSRPVVDLTVEPTAYLFGDAYCGAGGTSCGAKQAGVQIKWACDMDAHAVETYGLNFEGEINWCSFNDLLTRPKEELRVDIAHCSPPCQTFSPAHTINCERDDRNSACIFSAWNLLEHALPRILTMEETWGLIERHPFIFFRVIMDIIEAGFSVRWAVIDVLHYGVPQTRKRLIVIAAGPGETLPPFPEITHDLPGSGCLPVVTIEDAIKDIPEDAPDHDVERLLAKWATCTNAPYDARQPAKTLTCSGGEGNYHPSGLRTFTCREIACLQTFPMDFQFARRGVRKQVGNAVPPALAKALYQAIIASLRETDAREREQEQEQEQERERVERRLV